MKQRIFKSFRSYVSGFAAICLVILALMPLSRTVSFPAITEAAKFERIFAPAAAQIGQIAVRERDTVNKGDVLFTLTSPDHERDMEQTELQIRLVEGKLRRIASNQEDQDNYRVYQRQLEALKQRYQGLAREQARLVIKAPFAGQITDLERDLHAGRWVNSERPLATLRAPGGTIARGYAREEDVARLLMGSSGQFVPEDFNRPKVEVKLSQVSKSNVRSIDLPYLSSQNGFGVPVVKQADGSHAPVEPQYDVRLDVDGELSGQVIRGHVHLDARPQSLAEQIWRQIVQVLVRESGI